MSYPPLAETPVCDGAKPHYMTTLYDSNTTTSTTSTTSTSAATTTRPGALLRWIVYMCWPWALSRICKMHEQAGLHDQALQHDAIARVCFSEALQTVGSAKSIVTNEHSSKLQWTLVAGPHLKHNIDWPVTAALLDWQPRRLGDLHLHYQALLLPPGPLGSLAGERPLASARQPEQLGDVLGLHAFVRVLLLLGAFLPCMHNGTVISVLPRGPVTDESYA